MVSTHITIDKLQAPMHVFAAMSCGTAANRRSLQDGSLVDLFSLGGGKGGQDTRERVFIFFECTHVHLLCGRCP